MARRKPAGKTAVEGLRHRSAQRRNPPTEQTGRYMSDEDLAPETFRPSPTGMDVDAPRLAWRRGEGLEDMAVEATPLFIHEKIEPSAFVKSLEKGAEATGQSELFAASFNGLPKGANYEWYQHSGNWQNRIIRGPSVDVMASLAQKEGLAGQVQCIYFDPPYGINFKKSLQANAKKKPSGTSDSTKDFPGDAPALAAFRDAYTGGVHSYLDTIYRIARMSRELLADSGSFFLQISRKNLFRIALVLDEIFGDENQVTIIPFKKSGGTSSAMLPEGTDYILWYAKDKNAAKGKYRQLYEMLKDRKAVLGHMSSYAMLEMPDGSERKLTKEEKLNPERIPHGCKLFHRTGLISPGHSSTGRSDAYVWKGAPQHIREHWRGEGNAPLFPCPAGEHWRVSMAGMDRLADLGRLTAASAQSALKWKQYEDEIPGTRIANVWAGQMAPQDIHYVVETAESVIERCILMTTDPGDLVLDPTCGSGTTAYVAEKWGRRWITIDAGMAAVSLARQRIATGVFDAHMLQDSPEGSQKEAELQSKAKGHPVESPDPRASYENDVAKGFVYERVPTVSAAILAYDQDAPPTLLVDRTIKKPKTVRVASPFTVESHSPYRVLSPAKALEDSAAAANVRRSIEEALAKSGVLLDNVRMQASDLEPLAQEDAHGTPITHTALIDGEKAAVAIAPHDASVGRHFLTAAQSAATDLAASVLLVVAFHYECDVASAMVGRLRVHKARANQDLRIGELQGKAADRAIVCVGEPDIELREAPGLPGHYVVEIKGYDIYNPTTRNSESRDAADADVQCWMLDTDHDGESFFAHRIHFPGAGRDKQVKRFHEKLKGRLSPELWAATLSLTSAPFPAPERNGQIAVRVVTATHDEMSLVLPCGG